MRQSPRWRSRWWRHLSMSDNIWSSRGENYEATAQEPTEGNCVVFVPSNNATKVKWLYGRTFSSVRIYKLARRNPCTCALARDCGRLPKWSHAPGAMLYKLENCSSCVGFVGSSHQWSVLITVVNNNKVFCILYPCSKLTSQRTHDAIITSLWRPTSFWRHNEVIIAPCARWVLCFHARVTLFTWISHHMGWCPEKCGKKLLIHS